MKSSTFKKLLKIIDQAEITKTKIEPWLTLCTITLEYDLLDIRLTKDTWLGLYTTYSITGWQDEMFTYWQKRQLFKKSERILKDTHIAKMEEKVSELEKYLNKENEK